MRKNAPCVFLVLPLIVSVILMNGSAQGVAPLISLNPMEYEASAPDHSFTVDVNITDVFNLYVFEFQLYYDTNLLDAMNVTPGPVVPATRLLGPVDPETWEWIPINDTLGKVWVVCNFLSPASPFTDDGTLMTINFTATAEGSSALHFEFTKLLDPEGKPISHNKLDGSVTVIPEFPSSIVTPLLLIATLAATFLAKMVWSRKRLGPTIA